MKKLFLLAILFVSTNVLMAQENTLLVGGNIGIESQNLDFNGGSETKASTFEVNPFVGYQFDNHWTVGVESGIGSTKQEDSGIDTQDLRNFSIGAFARYTQSLSETFAVFGQLGAGYQSAKNKLNDADADGVYVGFTPVLFINFKNSFGLNFSIGGIRYETLNSDVADTNSFNFDFGQTVNIGISKNFGLGGKKDK